MNDPQFTRDSSADDQRLIAIAESYLAELDSGKSPDVEEIVLRNPDIAEPLRQLFESVQAIENFGRDLRTREEVEHRKPAWPELEDYEIVGELGRGGMGVVYEATQKSLARQVALKVLPLASIFDKKNLQRFRNEALATAQLNHPNIINVFAVGCEKGIHFYSMKLVCGDTLAEVIESLRDQLAKDPSSSNSKRLPLTSKGRSGRETANLTGVTQGSNHESGQRTTYFQSIARLGIQAADALHHAHELGIVHRDIKPSNLLLDDSGAIHVSDFGLATMQTEANLTASGDILGTLRYMSPEQASGQPERVDHLTDIYSLGATLYELLTCQSVVEAIDRKEMLRRILYEFPVLPSQINPNIPRDLETVVMKCLAKEKTDRYESARELADDLERFVEGQPIVAVRPGVWQRFRLWQKRNRWFATTAASFVALLLVGSLSSSLLVYRWYDRARLAEQSLTQKNSALNQALERELEAETELKDTNHRLLKVLARADVAENQVAEMPGLFMERGKYFYENQQYRIAIDLYETAMKLDPNLELEGHLLCGNCHFQLWNFDEAGRQAELATQSERVKPDSDSIELRTRAVLLRVRALMARARPGHGRFAAVDAGDEFQFWDDAELSRAHQEIEQILKSHPQLVHAQELFAKLSFLLAIGRNESQLLSQTIETANQVLHRESNNPAMFEIRQLSLWKMNRFEEFRNAWERRASETKIGSDGHLCLLKALLELDDGKPESATIWYERGLRRLVHRSTGFDHARLWVRNELIRTTASELGFHFDAWNDLVTWKSIYRYRIDSTDLLKHVKGEHLGDLSAQSGMNRLGREDWTPVYVRNGDIHNGVHIFWRPENKSSRLRFAIRGDANAGDAELVFVPGRYQLTASLSQSYDFGTVQLWWNGQRVGDPIDLYQPQPCQNGASDFGWVDLIDGENVLEIELVGVNRKAVGRTCIGIDYIDLWPEGFMPGKR